MKRQTYNLPYHAHFLSFSCYRRQRLLTSDPLRYQLLVNWNEARENARFLIWAYVIMPEHVHLLVYPKDERYQMSVILRSLKESFSRWLVKYWEQHAPQMLSHITVERGKRVLRRFWQEGGGYDRNLHNWDTIARCVDYIERNPLRRGLVKDPYDWVWSSAQARAGSRAVPLEIDDFETQGSMVGVDC